MTKPKLHIDPAIFDKVRQKRIALGEAYWKRRARQMRDEIGTLQHQLLWAEEYARIAKRKGIE